MTLSSCINQHKLFYLDVSVGEVEYSIQIYRPLQTHILNYEAFYLINVTPFYQYIVLCDKLIKVVNRMGVIKMI